MLNTLLLNTTPSNQYYISPSSLLSEELLVFNDYIFGGDITVTDLKEDSAPDRDLLTNKALRSHGQYIVTDYFSVKKITVKGWCKKNTQVELDSWIDEFKKLTTIKNGNLDIKRNGMNRRRYVATMINTGTMFDNKEPYHVTIAPFTCEFLCLDPFGYDTDYTYVSETITSSSVNLSVTNTGTFESKCIIYMSLDSGSVTNIKVTNLTNGANITIAETFSSGILRIDGEQLEVAINDVSKNFSGAFLNLKTGTNLLKFKITGTGFNLNTTVKWKNAFI